MKCYGCDKTISIGYTPVTDFMPTGKSPWLEVETSTFAEDWQKAVENPRHSDLTFVVDGTHRLQAHKVIVCSACKLLRKVLGVAERCSEVGITVTEDKTTILIRVQ